MSFSKTEGRDLQTQVLRGSTGWLGIYPSVRLSGKGKAALLVGEGQAEAESPSRASLSRAVWCCRQKLLAVVSVLLEEVLFWECHEVRVSCVEFHKCLVSKWGLCAWGPG